jgi:hypothetical protein
MTRLADVAGGMDLQEQVTRLQRREGKGIPDESALVTATGAAPAAWTVEVVSNVEKNLYTVRQVKILSVGVTPVAIGGSETQAFNLAESFLSAGSLATGTYSVMWRVGDRNVIYVKP